MFLFPWHVFITIKNDRFVELWRVLLWRHYYCCCFFPKWLSQEVKRHFDSFNFVTSHWRESNYKATAVRPQNGQIIYSFIYVLDWGRRTLVLYYWHYKLSWLQLRGSLLLDPPTKRFLSRQRHLLDMQRHRSIETFPQNFYNNNNAFVKPFVRLAPLFV